MKRLLPALILIVLAGCYSKAEKAEIQARKAFIDSCNTLAREYGFEAVEMKATGRAATVCKVKGEIDSTRTFEEEYLNLWLDENGFCSLGAQLKARGFEKLKTSITDYRKGKPLVFDGDTISEFYPHKIKQTIDLTEIDYENNKREALKRQEGN